MKQATIKVGVVLCMLFAPVLGVEWNTVLLAALLEDITLDPPPALPSVCQKRTTDAHSSHVSAQT